MTQLATCYYCARGHAMTEAGIAEPIRVVLAQVTVHDPRGCLHVCWPHARWRSTTSGGFGHSKDCAVGKEKP